MKRTLTLLLCCVSIALFGQNVPKLSPIKEKYLEGNLYLYEKKGKFGYKDADGHVVIKAVFDSAEPYEKAGSHGTVARVMCNGKWGIINRQGTWAALPEFDTISTFNKYGAVFENENGIGFITPDGSIICEGLQTFEGFNMQGISWFKKGGLWGVVDTYGIVKLPPTFTERKISPLYKNLYIGKCNGKMGLVDIGSYKLMLPPEYDTLQYAGSSTVHQIIVKKNGLWGVVWTNNTIALPIKYESVQTIGDDECFSVKINGKHGLYDRYGKEVIATVMEEPIQHLVINGENYYGIKHNGRYGVYDKYGKTVISPVMETNQFDKTTFRYWAGGKPYINENLKAKAYEIQHPVLLLPGLTESDADGMSFLTDCGLYDYEVRINKSKEIVYQYGFQSSANLLENLSIEVEYDESKYATFSVGPWFRQILNSIDGEKVIKYNGGPDINNDDIITLKLKGMHLCDDGQLFVVADLHINYSHLQRCAAIIDRYGTVYDHFAIDGIVYTDNNYILTSLASYYKIGDHYLVNAQYADADCYGSKQASKIYSSSGECVVTLPDFIPVEAVHKNGHFYIFGENEHEERLAYAFQAPDYQLDSLPFEFLSGENKILTSGDYAFLADYENENDYRTRRFFRLGDEENVFDIININSLIWDGRLSLAIKLKEAQQVFYTEYGKTVKWGDHHSITFRSPDSKDRAVYQYKIGGDIPVTRYGYYSQLGFTLPLFEKLEVGENVRFTIADTDHEMTFNEFIRKYTSSTSNLVSTKPLFQGGDANSFSKWVNQRLVYPTAAKDRCIQGRVTIQFTIDVDGNVKNVMVLRGVAPDLDKEAVRVVSSSPKWTPGTFDGKKVPVTYNIPVIFQLN